MENRVGVLEKLTSEQGMRLAELKTDIEIIKESLPDMRDVKEMLQELKKKKVSSEGGETSVNKDGKSEAGDNSVTESDEDDGDPPRTWRKRVELPTFEGNDPLGWVTRAEVFFEVHKVKPSERLRLAFICMEGNALHWFQFWRQKSKNASWEDFVAALLRRYGREGRVTVFERLAAIKQKGSVEDFIQDFELLVTQATLTPEEQLLGYFLAGLQQNIRNQVRLYKPESLIRAMEIARDVEEALTQNI